MLPIEGGLTELAPPLDVRETDNSYIVEIDLPGMNPDDVEVQFYVGRVNSAGEIMDASTVQMRRVDGQKDGWYRYETTQRPTETGRYGYTIRVLPKHPDLESSFIPGLITWVEAR